MNQGEVEMVEKPHGADWRRGGGTILRWDREDEVLWEPGVKGQHLYGVPTLADADRIVRLWLAKGDPAAPLVRPTGAEALVFDLERLLAPFQVEGAQVVLVCGTSTPPYIWWYNAQRGVHAWWRFTEGELTIAKGGVHTTTTCTDPAQAVEAVRAAIIEQGRLPGEEL